MNIRASGEGLTAALTLDENSIVAGSGAADAAPASDADNALKSELLKTAGITVTPSVTGITVDADDASLITVSTAGGAVNGNVQVTVTLEFPNKTTAQNGAQAGMVNLSGLGVTLTQTAPTAPLLP